MDFCPCVLLCMVKFVQKRNYFRGQLLSIDKYDSLYYNAD